MTIDTKILFATIFLIGTLISGLIVSKLGKPYNIGIFTLHKLVSIGFVIFMGLVAIIIHYLKTAIL